MKNILSSMFVVLIMLISSQKLYAEETDSILQPTISDETESIISVNGNKMLSLKATIKNISVNHGDPVVNVLRDDKYFGGYSSKMTLINENRYMVIIDFDEKKYNNIDLIPRNVTVYDSKENFKTLPWKLSKIKSPIVYEVADNVNEVKGEAKNNSKITIKLDNQIIGTAITVDGKFKVYIKRQKARSELKVISEFEGKTTETVTTVVDKTPPLIPALTTKISTKSTVIKGKTETESNVVLYINGQTLKKVKADDAGNFKIKVAKLKKGTVLELMAIDANDNKSKKCKITVK